MSNETYHILGASVRAAKLGLGNGIIIVIRKQKRGKTHTVKAIQRENNPEVLKIPPGTETAIYEFLKKTDALVYYIDDKDKWSRDEFTNGLRYMKNLTDSEKCPLKATHFTAESVREPESTIAWSWVLLNRDQYDQVNPILCSTGLEQRAIFLRAKHTTSEYDNIRKLYRFHKWGTEKLPKFRKYEDWYCSEGVRELTNRELKLIEKSFPAEKQGDIEKLASVMSIKGFKAVFKFLQVSNSGSYYDEYIDFEETDTEWSKRIEKEEAIESEKDEE